jgi:hypothetical protein
MCVWAETQPPLPVSKDYKLDTGLKRQQEVTDAQPEFRCRIQS